MEKSNRQKLDTASRQDVEQNKSTKHAETAPVEQPEGVEFSSDKKNTIADKIRRTIKEKAKKEKVFEDKAKAVFDRNPQLSTVYMTSDYTPFYNYCDASNYIKETDAEDKNIHTIKRHTENEQES